MTGFSQPERRALARSQSAQAHPDAELLNAFSEQTLTAREREQVLAHLAACPTCREVVSLAAPPVEEAVPEAVPASSAWKWPVLRWGAVAASAVIVVIAVSLVRFEHTPDMKMAQVTSETAPDAAPATSTQKTVPEAPASAGMKAPQVRYEKVSPSQDQKNTARAEHEPTEVKQKKESATPAVAAMAGAVVNAPPSAIKDDTAMARRDESVMMNKVNAGSVSTAAPPPPPAPAKTAAPFATSETVDVTAQAMTVEQAPRQQASGGVSSARELHKAQVGRAVAANRFQMNALDQRWQVTPEGYLLSSTDEGKNWARQLPDLRFTHVQAVGTHVWASGPEGVLMHSVDGGISWIKVTPVDQKSVLQGDITGIVFTDVNHGTLETSKGKRWTTSDAGQSWKKQ